MSEQEHEAFKPQFCKVSCNYLKHYHRVISTVIGCPAEDSWSRLNKVLILSTQTLILCASICLGITLGLRGYNVAIAFVLMRFVQLAFGLMRPHKTNEKLVKFSVSILIAINIICQLIAGVAIFGGYFYIRLVSSSLVLEFLLWESVLMPFCVATCAMINPKVTNYMQALKL